MTVSSNMSSTGGHYAAARFAATLLFTATLLIASGYGQPVSAQEKKQDEVDRRPEKVLVEIYRIAPGRHKKFLEDIARYDEANEIAGLPPRQLYIHSDGASWDFLLIQPAKTPEGKSEALADAWKELKLPSGANFFLSFRENILEHSDTFAYGPTSAASFLEAADD